MQNFPSRESVFNKKSPIDIYWFSGTGNTLVITIEIKKFLIEKGFVVNLIPLDIINSEDVRTESIIGFVIPVAGQSTYPFIWEFFKKLPETSGAPCFLVDTMGMYSGGIIGPVKKILKRKGYFPIAAKEIIMPYNFFKRKNMSDKDIKTIEKGKNKARVFCQAMIEGRAGWTDIPLYSDFISIFYRYRRLVNIWKIGFPFLIDPEKCNGCGICVRLCPEKSLELIDKKRPPKRLSNCSVCQRCFAFCPENAIRIGDKKSVPYHTLELKELLTYLKI